MLILSLCQIFIFYNIDRWYKRDITAIFHSYDVPYLSCLNLQMGLVIRRTCPRTLLKTPELPATNGSSPTVTAKCRPLPPAVFSPWRCTLLPCSLIGVVCLQGALTVPRVLWWTTLWLSLDILLRHGFSRIGELRLLASFCCYLPWICRCFH